MNHLLSPPVNLTYFLKHTEAHAILTEGVTDTVTLISILCDVIGFSESSLSSLPKILSKTFAAQLNSLNTPLPTSVWLAPMEPETRNWLAHCILNTNTVVEHSGSAPSETALVICSPLGQDVSSQVPADRTVGIDGFLPLDNLKRLTLMVNPATSLDALNSAVVLLKSTQKAISIIRDSAGFIVQRVLLTSIATACELAQQSLLTPQAIDQAILNLNLGYHQGLLEWADTLNPSRVAQTLAALKTTTGSTAYSPSLWLQRRAQLGQSLLKSEF
jgi:3-hydroxybutyryl-CoA dehydrogenase